MSTMFAALSNRHFRWLLSGNIAQFFAIAARMMVCNLLAWEITGEAVALAQINLVLAVPMFSSALFAGALVDRWERKRLITVGLSLVFLSELTILVALASDRLVFFHVLVVTFISGCIHPFVQPAGIAMMYSFLGRERIANGVALLSSGMNLSRILGPAIIGAVLAFFNTSIAYGVVVGLFFVALLCQLQLPKNQPNVREHKALITEIVEGLRYLVRERSVVVCLLFGLPPLMLLMTTQYMLVLFSQEVWDVGDAGLGVLLTSMGAGSFLGAMFVARFGPVISRVQLMTVGALGSALCFALFSQQSQFSVAVCLLMLSSMFAAVSLVSNQASIQLLAKEEVRGRVSAYVLMSYSLAPLVLFPLSKIAARFGAQVAIFSASLFVLLVVSVMFIGIRQVRTLDDDISAG